MGNLGHVALQHQRSPGRRQGVHSTFQGQRSRASQTAVWKDKDQNSALEVKLVFIPSVAFNFLLPISFHKWHNPFSSLICDAADFQLKVRRQIKSDSQHCLMTL